MKQTPLGPHQRHVLDALKQHGYWYPGCDWLWDTRSGTERILNSLVKRGLVKRVMGGRRRRMAIYYPAEMEGQRSN